MPEEPRKLKIGDLVRVKGFRTVAKVQEIDKHLSRGLSILLDREIDGFRWWDADDLIPAAPRKDTPPCPLTSPSWPASSRTAGRRRRTRLDPRGRTAPTR